MKSQLHLHKSATKVLARRMICALSLFVFFSTSARGQDHRYASLQPELEDRQVSDMRQSMQLAASLRPEERPQGLRRTVSLRLEGATLEQALRHIAAQAGLDLFFASRAVASADKLTLELRQVTAYAAMQEALKGTGLALMVLRGGQLVAAARPKHVEPRIPSAALALMKLPVRVPATIELVQLQTGTIAGAVADSMTGEPLPGVNVVIAGTQRGASTDADGRFVISELEAGSYDLLASFVGYATKRVEGVTVMPEDTTQVDIALNQARVGLEEVVVVGYGTQQRRDLTGSLSQVSTEDFENLPVTRVGQALQGHAAGVQVVRSGGAPGGEVTIRIRGTNSINASSDPLIVVDGFPAVEDLSAIDPDNIASIEILKGPSATAIYGARGAGGVVLITTKQGRAGEPQVEFNASYSFANVGNKLDLLDAEQYARLANEANASVGQPPDFENPVSLGAGVDWQDQIFQTGLRQDYQLSVSGGSEDVQYFISGGYLNQEGIIIGSHFKRGTMRFNLDGEVSDRLSVGSHVSLSRIKANQAGGQSVRNALLYPPTVPVRDKEKDYTHYTVPQLELENPVAGVLEPRIENNTYRGLVNGFAEYSVMEEVEIRTSLGGNFRYGEFKQYIPTTLLAGRLSGGEADVSSEKEIEWLSESTISYSDSYNDRHELELLAGYTLQRDTDESVATGASQFAIELLGFNDLSAGSLPAVPQTGVTESTLQSYIFRANYRLDDKYLFTATGRYDGSSKFGEGNKYGFFPSGAIAWRLSEESFLEGADFLTDLKLRAAYGITGNQSIGAYASLAMLSGVNTIFGESQSRSIGIQPTRVSNPDLKWEETSQLDIGIDATFFRGHVSITADYYLKRTSDLLLAVALPSQTGFTSTIRNIGSVRNTGIELSININTNLGQILWSSNMNITRNSNEVTDLGVNDEIFPAIGVGTISSVNDQSIIIREGEPLGSFYGFVQDDLFQSQQDVQNSAQPNAEVGTPRIRDLNKDGIIDGDDKTIIGNGQPTGYGSFSNTFTYRNFSLSVQLIGLFGKDILNSSRIELESVNGAINNLETVIDRWTPQNRDTNIPKANASGYPYLVTSRFIEDGSYLRIQNVRLSYEIPQGWVGGLRRAEVYMTGTNLYTFTGYSGYDPEINFQGGSNAGYSIAYNPYPIPRTLTIGLRLGL